MKKIKNQIYIAMNFLQLFEQNKNKSKRVSMFSINHSGVNKHLTVKLNQRGQPQTFYTKIIDKMSR